MEELNNIKMLISQGEIDQAIKELDKIITLCPSSCDEAYYLRGNAYRKLGNLQQALNNYLYAIDINPESPAKAAHEILMDILNFYHKDMYNQ